MNYQSKLHGIEWDIEYDVDSDGDYSQFDICINGVQVNDVLNQKIIDDLEADTWDNGYIPDCQPHNDDLKIERFLSSQEA